MKKLILMAALLFSCSVLMAQDQPRRTTNTTQTTSKGRSTSSKTTLDNNSKTTLGNNGKTTLDNNSKTTLRTTDAKKPIVKK